MVIMNFPSTKCTHGLLTIGWASWQNQDPIKITIIFTFDIPIILSANAKSDAKKKHKNWTARDEGRVSKNVSMDELGKGPHSTIFHLVFTSTSQLLSLDRSSQVRKG